MQVNDRVLYQGSLTSNGLTGVIKGLDYQGFITKNCRFQVELVDGSIIYPSPDDLLPVPFKVGDRLTDCAGIAEVTEVTPEGMRLDWTGEGFCPVPPTGKGCWHNFKKDKNFIDQYQLYCPELFPVGSLVELTRDYFSRPTGDTGIVLPSPETTRSPYCISVKWHKALANQPSQELVPPRYLIVVFTPAEQALCRALKVDSSDWATLRSTGSSDAELKDAIASAFGIASGGSKPTHWAAEGGKNPAFWLGMAEGKPLFQGKKLVEKVRLLLNIPFYKRNTNMTQITNTNDATTTVPTEIVNDSIDIELDAKEFRYEAVKAETADFLKEVARDIKQEDKRWLEGIISTGRKLLSAKERLRQEMGHGYFMGWLKIEFPHSHETARLRMNAARRFEGIEIPNDLDFAPRVIQILSAPSKDEEQEQELKQAVEEALRRAQRGLPVTQKDAKDIVSDHKGEIADKLYIYRGQPAMGTLDGVNIELQPGALVYPASISLTDPSQIFIRILDYPKSVIQVSRADLELKSLCQWEVGDRAKLISVKGKHAKQWIGEEVEIDELCDAENQLEVSVVKQRGARFKVSPNQLDRNVGMWRDASGLFHINGAPPKGRENSYIRIDILSVEEQIELSNQRVQKCQDRIAELTQSNAKGAKKGIEDLEAEIKKEQDYQAVIAPSASSHTSSPPSSSKAKNENHKPSQQEEKEPTTAEEALADCPFKAGNRIQDIPSGDFGKITKIEVRTMGSPKSPHFCIYAHIDFDNGEKRQVPTHYLKIIATPQSLAEVTDARSMDAYADEVGFKTIVDEWAKTTPQERKRIHAFYPGLQGMAQRQLGQLGDRIIKADELFFKAEEITKQPLPESLLKCTDGQELKRYIEADTAVAAREYIEEFSYSQRNQLRRLLDVDKLLVDLGYHVADLLLLADRDAEIVELKAQIQQLAEENAVMDKRNLELEGQNGDLLLKKEDKHFSRFARRSAQLSGNSLLIPQPRCSRH